MAPKFWMACRCFTITFLRDIISAPLDRQTVMIMGSISGVSPTATDSENSRASAQLPLVKPTIRNVTETISTMNRIISQVKPLTPLSKLDASRRAMSFWAIEPKWVLAPVLSTRPRAEPLSTLVPMKQAFVNSKGARPAGWLVSAFFSTGMDSPVNADWVTKKSFAERMRRSAGIRLPAARITMSPGAISSSGTSTSAPSRNTVTVVLTSFCSFSTAFEERASWT